MFGLIIQVNALKKYNSKLQKTDQIIFNQDAVIDHIDVENLHNENPVYQELIDLYEKGNFDQTHHYVTAYYLKNYTDVKYFPEKSYNQIQIAKHINVLMRPMANMTVQSNSQMITFSEILQGYQYDGLLYDFPSHNDTYKGLEYPDSINCEPTAIPDRIYDVRCRSWYIDPVQNTDYQFYMNQPTEWIIFESTIYVSPLCWKTYDLELEPNLISVTCTVFTLQK
ncbi:hypothetical protein PPERSA_00622 [Pseudocohnilembus persalinus]|uniref:Uncharacterized protein n=1 Tax=Pseudocohnilembus persalinus TaxID=266149 RepID=A0A0V0QSK4_PSEPJ|nr:hypothetical protein PPERSA_00622 [Pseudocohnilembus persalinus]|eukprot:KRX05321.1 hypothetical protein PPERSA_00622 [Pseudocohnilembus persalinus]